MSMEVIRLNIFKIHMCIYLRLHVGLLCASLRLGSWALLIAKYPLC